MNGGLPNPAPNIQFIFRHFPQHKSFENKETFMKKSGMVVRKLFRIAFALFLKAHRIALHRIRIALFTLSSPFWSLFYS
jgi:hypothetical protein